MWGLKCLLFKILKYLAIRKKVEEINKTKWGCLIISRVTIKWIIKEYNLS